MTKMCMKMYASMCWKQQNGLLRGRVQCWSHFQKGNLRKCNIDRTFERYTCICREHNHTPCLTTWPTIKWITLNSWWVIVSIRMFFSVKRPWWIIHKSVVTRTNALFYYLLYLMSFGECTTRVIKQLFDTRHLLKPVAIDWLTFPYHLAMEAF